MGPNRMFFGVEITGDEIFKRRILESLTLLKISAEKEFAFVTNRIKKIRQGFPSGISFETDPPVLSLSNTSALYSITWCAAGIAHDAYHVEIENERSAQLRRGVTPKTYDFREAETRCLKFQYQVLDKIGASNHELKYLKSIKGNFPDLNGDGAYDWKDYKLRVW